MLDTLLAEHPNNVVLANGFNTAGSMPYLPGTGGLLAFCPSQPPNPNS